MPAPALQLRIRDLQQELARLRSWGSHPNLPTRWTEHLNELRLVRATLAWEEFVEQSFVCYLRGCPSVTGRVFALKVATESNSRTALSTAIGPSNHHGNWISERWTLGRASSLFSAPSHPYVVLADPIISEIRRVRNRIVHRSEYSRRDFHSVVTSRYGSLRPGMTPGRLLTDRRGGTARIDEYMTALEILATSIIN